VFSWLLVWFVFVPLSLGLMVVPFGSGSPSLYSLPLSFSFSVHSFLSFPLFFLCLSLSPPLLPLACWRCGGVFIGQKEAEASLLPPYSSAWGAGLCYPATTPGWLANGWGWQGAAPLFFFFIPIMRVHKGLVLAGMREERDATKIKEKKQNLFFLPLLHVQGKKKKEQCRSKRHRSDPFF